MQAGPAPWVFWPCLFAGLAENPRSPAGAVTQAESVRAAPGGRAAVLPHLCFLASLLPLAERRPPPPPVSARVCPPRGVLREPLQCQSPVPWEVGGRAAGPAASSQLGGSPGSVSHAVFLMQPPPSVLCAQPGPPSSCISGDRFFTTPTTPAGPMLSSHSLSY